MSGDVSHHSGEPHWQDTGSRLNWLRAGVLGANDGIVSTAGMVVGVAAATAERGSIFTAGVAGIAAGAISMALGEYVSVSTQRDTERALLEKERTELRDSPEPELAELAFIYESKGLSPSTARQVATELTAHNAFAAHAEAELHIDPHGLTNPWHAAVSSAVSFLTGAMLPMIAILLPPAAWRISVTALGVCIALVLTGWISATLGEAGRIRAISRVTFGGLAAMGVTYLIGTLVGHAMS